MTDEQPCMTPESPRVRLARILDNIESWGMTDRWLTLADRACFLGWENAIQEAARKIGYIAEAEPTLDFSEPGTYPSSDAAWKQMADRITEPPQDNVDSWTKEQCVDWLNANVGTFLKDWFVSEPIRSVRLERVSASIAVRPDAHFAWQFLVQMAMEQQNHE